MIKKGTKQNMQRMDILQMLCANCLHQALFLGKNKFFCSYECYDDWITHKKIGRIYRQ